MNSADMATNLIYRAKNLQEFTVTTELPSNFKFQGVIPFDMHIADGMLEARVWAIDFDEAVERLNQFLQNDE